MTPSPHRRSGPSSRRFRSSAVPGVRLGRPGRPAVLGVGVILVLTVVAAAGWARGPGGGGVDPATSGGRALGSAAAEPSVRPVPGHEVYAFVPYWEMDGSIGGHVAAADVTTVGLFSVTHTGSGKLATGQSGYQRITGPVGRGLISDAHAHHRRAEIAYTSFGRAKNTKLFGDVALQDRVIAALAELRRRLDADGIAVDVEDIDDTDIAAFGGFVGRLRAALHADAPK